MVNLDLEKDLRLLRETATTVAHNASSNCKLASGIAAVPEMLQNDVNVSLGTDGAPCANTYDMIQEMRLAALLQKGSRRDAAAITAEQVLNSWTSISNSSNFSFETYALGRFDRVNNLDQDIVTFVSSDSFKSVR